MDERPKPLKFAERVAPAVAASESRERSRGPETERQRQLENFIVLAVASNQLSGNVELERLTFAPIINAPLVKEHVPVATDAAPIGPFLKVEIRHQANTFRRCERPEGMAELLDARQEGSFSRMWFHFNTKGITPGTTRAPLPLS
jgi:hypothetical protein